MKASKQLSIFLLIFLTGCVVIPTRTPTPKWTATPTATAKVSATKTSTPMSSPTPTPPYILPSVTMSPDEVEQALSELLRTNGGCKGKCIAGIYPDEMNVQEAVDQLAQWGPLKSGGDNDFSYVKISQPTLSDLATIYLGFGSYSKFTKPIDEMEISITRILQDGELISGEIWQANREAWQAFQFDQLLKAYEMPSFVGFYFSSLVEDWSDLNGRSIEYMLDLYYEEYNLAILFYGIAYYNAGELRICPSLDPHNLSIVINPSLTKEERETIYRSTWQGLTGTDLTAFYQKFTDETNPDACFTTTVEKILELDPYFR